MPQTPTAQSDLNTQVRALIRKSSYVRRRKMTDKLVAAARSWVRPSSVGGTSIFMRCDSQCDTVSFFLVLRDNP